MAKKIELWQSEDGQRWDTQAEADAHDAGLVATREEDRKANLLLDFCALLVRATNSPNGERIWRSFDTRKEMLRAFDQLVVDLKVPAKPPTPGVADVMDELARSDIRNQWVAGDNVGHGPKWWAYATRPERDAGWVGEDVVWGETRDAQLARIEVRGPEPRRMNEVRMPDDDVTDWTTMRFFITADGKVEHHPWKDGEE